MAGFYGNDVSEIWLVSNDDALLSWVGPKSQSHTTMAPYSSFLLVFFSKFLIGEGEGVVNAGITTKHSYTER